MTKPTSDTLILDELEQRLSCERISARLYEVIRSRVERDGENSGVPSLQALDRIILQKYSHFRLLTDLIHLVGSEATVEAALSKQSATISIVSAAVDPRTSLIQCLETALLAEITDREGWQTLLKVLDEGGHERAADHVRQAVQLEGLHLELVRDWLAKAVERSMIGRAMTLPEAAFAEQVDLPPG